MSQRSLLIAVLLFTVFSASAQKSRVLSAVQLMESEKYEDAKELIELAAKHKRTAEWPRTWYTRGLLCQTAFEKGFEKSEKKKINLYPNQLYVAYSSYQKALRLDKREKIKPLIAQQYYTLSNDFQKLGGRLYKLKDFEGATKAFEHALILSKSQLISAETDVNLVYNTAMSAYAGQDWEKAISYLEGLNQDAYSPNAALLLYRAHIAAGDSLAAGEVLYEGLSAYNYDTVMVLQFVDHLVREERSAEALDILDTALIHRPGAYVYPWTKGLVLQGMERYQEAILSFERALAIAPMEETIYYHLGVCYYNMGVKKSDEALRIRQNAAYREAREEARSLFEKSVQYLENAHQINLYHRPTNTLLLQLYHRLQLKDKQAEMERLLR
ncbi:MAG: hypothetical protein CSA96_03775 [Bacteroidetes bacterium]|nr:MAG: hypothetical protein CSA96_03775 [Bacteroidota bacterium]